MLDSSQEGNVRITGIFCLLMAGVGWTQAWDGLFVSVNSTLQQPGPLFITALMRLVPKHCSARSAPKDFAQLYQRPLGDRWRIFSGRVS